MPTLAEKITAAKAALVAKRDQLQALSAKQTALADGETLTTEDDALVEELSTQIERDLASLATLEKTEAALAKMALPAGENRSAALVTSRKPSADFIVRAAFAAFESHCTHQPIEAIVARRWPSSIETAETTKLLTMGAITRAAQSPAMTTVPGWAQELVRDSYGAFMELLQPESVVPRLPMLREEFGNATSIVLPARDAVANPNLAAAFRAEGAPIRVGAARLTSKRLTQKSMGVIGTFTRELLSRSTPSIEGEIRRWMIEDTATKLDATFLDNVAGDAIRPAGLQNYVGAGDTAASSGNTAANIVTDIRGRLSAISTAHLGRNLRWIMNPARMIGATMSYTPTGDRAFPEAASGQLAGIPVIASTTVPADIVFLVDAAELAFAGGAPEFSVSDQATIHEDDGAPNTNMVTGASVLPIASGAAGAGVVATPVRSLFQTYSVGIRAVWLIDWTVLRPHAVQTITGVAW